MKTECHENESASGMFYRAMFCVNLASVNHRASPGMGYRLGIGGRRQKSGDIRPGGHERRLAERRHRVLFKNKRNISNAALVNGDNIK